MSAFGGKADMRPTSVDVRFLPKADMSGSGLLPSKLTPKPPFRGSPPVQGLDYLGTVFGGLLDRFHSNGPVQRAIIRRG
jgi:hypothetical protein